MIDGRPVRVDHPSPSRTNVTASQAARSIAAPQEEFVATGKADRPFALRQRTSMNEGALSAVVERCSMVLSLRAEANPKLENS